MKIKIKELKPIIQTEEPDKYGRTVKVGIQDGSYSTFLQVMSVEEAKKLRDELTKFLSGVNSPGCFYIPEELSLEEIREQAKVGDEVRVRFEEFGMPDKHVVGRVIHPKRVYRSIKITERYGNHCKGKALGDGKEMIFNAEQIVDFR